MAPYLMLGLIFVAILNIFFNKDLIARQIGKNNFLSIIKASLFGVPLPLCSCGVVPSTIYLAKNGASKGSVISFLISTPQTGIDSIIATYGILGPIFAIFRPISAFLMGILGGTIVRAFDKKNVYNDSNNDKFRFDSKKSEQQQLNKSTFTSKLSTTLKYAFVEFIDDISTQFFIGLIIAGLISYVVPNNFFANTGVNSGILGMLLMILVGIPMYVCATASIPIALTLINIGFSPGVAFVFLVVGPATNAASLIILNKVLGKKTILIYLLTISILAIIFGYLLDAIFYLLGNPLITSIHTHYLNHVQFSLFQIVISSVFAMLLVASFYRKLKPKFVKTIKKDTDMNKYKVIIQGMSCNHCVMNVKNTIAKLDGVKNVEVVLAENAAYIEGNYNKEDLKKAIEDIGYKVT